MPEEKTYSSPYELMDRFMGVWIDAFKRSNSQPSKTFAQLTLGMVTAAKLLVRLTNQGDLVCTLQPELNIMIERISDKLVVRLQKRLEEVSKGTAEMLRQFPLVVFREADPKPYLVKYLRLVQSGAPCRWVHPPADLATPVPQDLQDLLDPSGADVRSIEIARAITQVLVDSRRTATDKSHEMTSQYCALFAMAKWSLTLWGNQSRAATIEYLAEVDSARLYRKIIEQTQARKPD